MNGKDTRKSEWVHCTACGERLIVDIQCPHCNALNVYLYSMLEDETRMECKECGGDLRGSCSHKKAVEERDAQLKKRAQNTP